MTDRALTLASKVLRSYDDATFALLAEVSGRRTARISLRVLDWFVTSYARRFDTNYAFGGGRVFVFHEYKAMLKSYSKAHFDPFCRRARLFVDTKRRCAVAGPAGGDVIATTTGQLNFFLWAVQRGVLTYSASIIDAIEKDLSQTGGRTAHAAWCRHAMLSVAAPVTVSFE